MKLIENYKKHVPSYDELIDKSLKKQVHAFLRERNAKKDSSDIFFNIEGVSREDDFIVINGWIIKENSSAELKINNTPILNLSEREDVQQAYPELSCSLNSGFSVAVPVEQFTGLVTFSIRDGVDQIEITESLELCKTYIESCDLDSFANGRARVTVRGWIFSPYDNLKIRASRGSLISGELREDVSEHFSNQFAKNSGFTLSVDIKNTNKREVKFFVEGEDCSFKFEENISIWIPYAGIQKTLKDAYKDIPTYKSLLSLNVNSIFRRFSRQAYLKHYSNYRDDEIYDDFDFLDIEQESNLNFLNDFSETVDVIIPVYNGFEFLEGLFSNVKKSNIKINLVIIDDCSPDERVLPFLRAFVEKTENATLISNEQNLGFIGSVNKGLKFSKNHKVILNSDVVVPPFWLERLITPIVSNKTIASVTPMTNAGTVVSFPKFLEDNELPKGYSVEEIDTIFSSIPKQLFSSPTGVGFCMALNKKVVQEIGCLDPIFGKGYAEENDWCQRAIKHGYTNELLTNLFVWHKHGGSFTSEEKQRLISKNLGILNERYPGYDASIQNIIKKDPLRKHRFFALLHMAEAKRGLTLFIDHNLSGGTRTYSNEFIANHKDQGILVLRYNSTTSSRLELEINLGANEESIYIKNYDIFIATIYPVLKELKIKNVILNSLVTFPKLTEIFPFFIKFLNGLNYDFFEVMVHDFYSICPSYTLLNDKGQFCGVPDKITDCQKCILKNQFVFSQESNQVDMKDWREGWSSIKRLANQITVFSEDSANHISKAYPQEKDKIVVKPHVVDNSALIPIKKQSNKKPGLSVGVIGAINYAKGSVRIERLSKLMEQDSHGKITIFGETNNSYLQQATNVEVTGRYEMSDLTNLIIEREIDVFFFSSIWPETFSFVTDHMMRMNLPIVAYDIGAPAERLKEYDKAKIIDLNASPNELFASLIESTAL